MTPPRVFVVQPPGHASKAFTRKFDLAPALDYGPLVYLLPETCNPFEDLQSTARAVEDGLRLAAFGPEDWLLLVGNPVLIGLVAAAASQLTGSLRVLQWNRDRQQYYPASAQLSRLAAPRATA